MPAKVTIEYVGQLPEEDGNFYGFDLLNGGQFVAKAFTRHDGQRFVLCGSDNQVHPAADYERPNCRFFQIHPMSRAEMDKFLSQPV